MFKNESQNTKIFIYLLVWCFTQKNRNISKISLTLANATDDTTNWTNIVSQESIISEETNTGFDTYYFGTLLHRASRQKIKTSVRYLL